MTGVHASSVDLLRHGSATQLSADRPAADISVLLEKIIAAGSSYAAVCRAAGVSASHFGHALAGRRRASRWYIRRCELALDRLLAGDPGEAEPSDQLIRALYNAYLGEAARHYGISLDEAGRAGTAGPRAHARQLAWYLVNTEFCVRKATLARLFGLTRAALSLAINSVEDRRDDPRFDEACEDIAGRIRRRT